MMIEVKIDIDLFLAMVSDGQLDMVDVRILDCITNRSMTRRAAGRAIGVSEATVRKRIARMPQVFNRYLGRRKYPL